MACCEGYEDIARILIEYGADVNSEVEVKDAGKYISKTPPQLAAYSGHLPVVQTLIASEAEVNHFNIHGTALSIAAKKDKLGVVQELLHADASIIDSSGRRNALTEACKAGSLGIVELLWDELPVDLEAMVTNILRSYNRYRDKSHS